jgi:hypothetical protein
MEVFQQNQEFGLTPVYELEEGYRASEARALLGCYPSNVGLGLQKESG